jgi:hypothetical protein
VLCDSDIRKLLLSHLSSQDEDNPSLVVEELGLNQGDARIDVAVVNGHLHGYEIKSDRDSLRRFHRQERVNYRAGRKHLPVVQLRRVA